ncbi:arylalkylamine N-acetyltransferase-like 2 [Drosophila tropicalis]|uniref:arylalkylamine N-acetyltransferase-like 2 n=1 Tax=Drosophila tropicalis TaxID=46794 RepID=UPI0035ABB8A2
MVASNISTENGIAVRIMSTEDYDQVELFLRDHYYNADPLMMSCPGDLYKFGIPYFDEMNLSLIKQNTSLIAIDELTNSIAGVVIAGAQAENDVEEHRLLSEALGSNIFGCIERLVSEVERKSNVYQRFNVNKLLYSHVTCVDTLKRGQGLGVRLAKTLIKLGRAKGFKLMLALCSSFYSARQKHALGMECIYAQAYADYKDDEGRAILTPPAPHTHIRVMAMKL